ncbi:MAG TPA: sucrase ferredoxin [Gaiella sp.]|uniref:sucrase ferredoxin n=1 Tax=Gaiella sp. TaxID=2663207 RepID=UPI002D7E5B8F|nr:sucrase ferredoxin [Gaiella sp.]HET9287910.1 sucrase ferredoxin [Gaiella sp.]
MSVNPRAATAGRAFCAAVSSASGESLAATASRIDHWILVEYRGRWGRDVLGGSLFSPELKAHLRGQLAALGRARLLFVRQPQRRSHGGRRVFVGTSKPGEERFFRLEVEHQEDLREVDLAAALAGGDEAGARIDQPLFVVCTHGKRDACCALHGGPLYDALRRETDADQVWQSTHVGGDRFAGNVVVLPHGLYYGRVVPADVGDLLAAQRSGHIDLDRYRGRSAYSFPVQAAEQAIRESEGLLGIDELVLLGSSRTGDDAWSVRFGTRDGAVHEVDVAATLADEPMYLTCGSSEPQLARRHRATAHRVLSR